MLQVTILQAPPSIIEGVSSKTNKPYRILRQAAVVTLPSGAVEAFMMQGRRVNGRDEPYSPGNYTLAPESFYVRDGAIAFSPKLAAIAEGRGGAK